jgi:predicted anti-sigma-YlaC factor YlaD
MGFILILNFGVLGLIATSLVSSIPSLIIGLRYVGKHYNVSVDWQSSAKILLSSATAAAVTYAVISQLGFASWIRLIVGAAIFLATFIPAVLLTRAISRPDLDNLHNMASSLGSIAKLLNGILDIMEKAMNALKL